MSELSPSGTMSIPPPPSLDGVDLENPKIQAFVAYYQTQFERMKRMNDKLKVELHSRSEYASRLEVDLVTKKVELVNTVDRMNDLENENISFRRELGLKVQKK